MVKPITRKDIPKFKIDFWDEIIEAFNECIKEEWNGSKATVLQEDVVQKIMLKKNLETKDEIYKNKQLDVEGYYASIGWEVLYNSPSMGESFDSYYTFK